MLKHVGDHVNPEEHIFAYATSITKPNGEVVTKEGTLPSGYIDTL